VTISALDLYTSVPVCVSDRNLSLNLKRWSAEVAQIWPNQEETMQYNTKISEHAWLRLVGEAPRRDELVQLAKERYDLSLRGVEKNITQAVAAGLVESVLDPANGRKRLLQLTEQGQALLSARGFLREMGSTGWGYRKRQAKQCAEISQSAEVTTERAEIAGSATAESANVAQRAEIESAEINSAEVSASAEAQQAECGGQNRECGDAIESAEVVGTETTAVSAEVVSIDGRDWKVLVWGQSSGLPRYAECPDCGRERCVLTDQDGRYHERLNGFHDCVKARA
jgi:DNA-binding MarR family transcriptional regulator